MNEPNTMPKQIKAARASPTAGKMTPLLSRARASAEQVVPLVVALVVPLVVEVALRVAAD